MCAKICQVEKGSPGYKAGIKPGQELISINGHNIADVLDYKFYAYDSVLNLQIDNKKIRIKKDEGEDLGLVFESYLMDKAKRCANRCVFCFIDQLPEGMRETLYFKDDDARMSFLMGNYITLTNLSEQDIERMINMRISPVNISVHATDPQVRKDMLRNPKAGECLEVLKRFANANININCQIVVCPGVNDGEILKKSLEDLISLAPAVNSVSIVPVGLTKHRENLFPLEPIDKEKAAEIIDLVDRYGDVCVKDNGTRIVYCGDELYIKAKRNIPDIEYYEDFPQLENGVGLIALMEEEFMLALDDVEGNEKIKPFTIATGVSAAPFIAKLIDELAKKCNNIFDRKVIAVSNRFFGESIDVAGLVTGHDLIDRLSGEKLGERVFIPEVMLRHGTSVFLDDVSLEQVQDALGVPVIPVPNDGGALLDYILSE